MGPEDRATTPSASDPLLPAGNASHYVLRLTIAGVTVHSYQHPGRAKWIGPAAGKERR